MQDEITQEDLEARIAEQLSGFAGRLTRLVTDNAAKRSHVEDRWLRDLRQYHGKYTEKQEQELESNSTSKIFVNITRNKSNAAEARVQDMLFPTDDRNFGLRPTPVPDMAMLQNVEQAQQVPGMAQPAEGAQPVTQLEEAAAEKAELMQTEIDDQLKEARYQAKARDAIHDMVVLGTGILKGPTIINKTEKRWKDEGKGVMALNHKQKLAPSVEHVNIWDFYPDMSANCHRDCEFYFERHVMTKKQLRTFARLPGVIYDQVKQLVADQGETKTSLVNDRQDDIRSITGVNSVGIKKGFEIWEYHGPINKSELLTAINASGTFDMPDEEIDELDDEIDAVVFFSGQSVLKVAINPMETMEHPYSVVNWEKDDASLFGFGVPYLMRHAQVAINGAWRMMLDNGGQAVTDQIIVNRDLVEPSDGSWNTRTRKVWFTKGKDVNVQNVFGVFETRQHQAEYANIFNMARQLADEETNLPLIAQGEQASHVTRTSSGMAMLMNSANIVLRKAIKNWDDDVTDTLITRFYDWNMQFNTKQEIKGDYTIDARGSSALLVREKQQESLMMLANLSASYPQLAERRDWEGMDRELAKALEVQYENITLSDEKIKQNQEIARKQQQEQGDPRTQVQMAQINLKREEFSYMREMDAIKLEIGRLEHEEEMLFKREDMAAKRELELAKLKLSERVEDKKIAAKFETEIQKDRTTRQKLAADIDTRLAQLKLQARNLSSGYDTF